MDSISKLNTAILSVPNELTVAAANFNLDFSLMKVEAPKEFHGLRDALSNIRRGEAEEGQPHITARKLGALFDSILPPITHLIQAYGKRVSAISSRSMAEKRKHPNISFLADQAGPDGTNIWAAATSGQAALAVHLLACMLARIWKSHEATSLWVELVERRKQEINDKFNNTNAAETAAIIAARQIISRQQLASWDASARSWLQTADADRRFQQTQLMLVINNIRVPVNGKKDPYGSVLKAWTTGMCAMERLVQGIPQQVQDGAVLLAMSSWHLYPNMSVLANEIKDIDQHDELMNGALITISAYGANPDKEGVFWSLPLSRLRYYSPPVVTERRIASDTSRVSMSELWIIVLGVITSQWNYACPDTEKCFRLIILLSSLVNQSSTHIAWLRLLADAAKRYLSTSDVDHSQHVKLLRLGMRWGRSFLNEPGRDPPPFFGLSHFPVLMSMISEIEEKIAIMRKIARTLQASDQDLLIRYPEPKAASMSFGVSVAYHLASALPSSPTSVRTSRGDGEPAAKRQCHTAGMTHYRWLVSKFGEPDVSCDGHACSCVSPHGPECICDKLGGGCTIYCHCDLSGLRQCNSASNFLNGKCKNGCTGEGQCTTCYLRSQVSRVEKSGEQCIITRDEDIRHVDNWHFLLETSDGDGIIYDFVLGDVDDVAIFKRNDSQILRYLATEHGSPASMDEIMDSLASPSIDRQKLRCYLEDWWRERRTGHNHDVYQQGCSLNALVFASELYGCLEGATVSIETIKRPLYEAMWARWTNHSIQQRPNAPSSTRLPTQPREFHNIDGSGALGSLSFETDLKAPIQTENDILLHEGFQETALLKFPPEQQATMNYAADVSEPRVNASAPPRQTLGDISSRLAASFACIAMLETGEFNIDPNSLRGVMALSTGDSIYIASSLVSDPSENTYKHPVRRVFGNLGRPEMAFLLPPSKPKLTDYDLKSWHLINHLPFDGKFVNKFASTSLHLSFTDFELPLDVVTRGLRDTLVILVETLLSINERGKPLGDLDIIPMFNSEYLTLMPKCGGHNSLGDVVDDGHEGIISIDSWEEFFDLPSSTGIVRANGNWEARLAIAAASVQRARRTLILPQKPCLQCLHDYTTIASFDIIVA